MRDLHRYVENPFDNDGVSVDELLSFSTDHLQRLISNNASGDFTARITATTTALNACESQITNDQTKLGLRKARKQMKEAFRKSLPATIGKLCGAVAARYGENSPEMTECCPQGRKIFSSCTDDQLTTHLQTFKNGVEAHEGDLGSAVVNSAEDVLTAWQGIYAASESATGVKTLSEASKKTARQNLQKALFLNLLKIAEVFAGQTEQLDLYMQQSLLEITAPEPQPQPA